MTEINVGNLEFYNEIEIGDLQLDVKNVYPELEKITVQSRKDEQLIKPTKYGFSEVTVEPIVLKDIEITQNGVYKIPIDADGYGIITVNVNGGTSGLTTEQIEALNNMKVSIVNGNLIFDYDDEILKLDFNLENDDLIVENNLNGLDFNINKNGELEAIY